MEISVRKSMSMCYVTIIDGDTTITTDVANIHGHVNEALIHQLRGVADDLEQHNEDNK